MPLLFGAEGMDGRPWEIDPQLRARCARLVRALPREFPSHLAAVVATAGQDGVPRGPVRHCPALDDVDGRIGPGVTSAGTAEVKRTRAGNEQLCEDEEMLHPASILLAGSSIPATADPGVPRRDESRGLRGAAGPGGVGPVSKAAPTLTWLPDAVALDIVDDGVGFDPDRSGAPSSGGGYGLELTRTRVEQAGGTFTVESSAGGTAVAIALPLTAERHRSQADETPPAPVSSPAPGDAPTQPDQEACDDR